MRARCVALSRPAPAPAKCARARRCRSPCAASRRSRARRVVGRPRITPSSRGARAGAGKYEFMTVRLIADRRARASAPPLSSPRKRGSILPSPRCVARWVPAFAGTTACREDATASTPRRHPRDEGGEGSELLLDEAAGSLILDLASLLVDPGGAIADEDFRL